MHRALYVKTVVRPDTTAQPPAIVLSLCIVPTQIALGHLQVLGAVDGVVEHPHHGADCRGQCLEVILFFFFFFLVFNWLSFFACSRGKTSASMPISARPRPGIALSRIGPCLRCIYLVSWPACPRCFCRASFVADTYGPRIITFFFGGGGMCRSMRSLHNTCTSS